MEQQDQQITIQTESHRNSRPYYIVGGLILCVVAIVLIVITQKSQHSIKSSANNSTYQNPFISPSPHYENPFDQSPTQGATDQRYQNPF